MEFNEEKNEQEASTEEEMTQEDASDENSEESASGKFNQWLQDNLRIVISVLIVVMIAGLIYSYSKRSEAPIEVAQNTQESVMPSETEDQTQQNTLGENDEQNQSSQTTQDQNAQTQSQTQTEDQTQTQQPTNTTSTSTSQETEQSFVETAGHGDSKTTLARAALAHYLEKNPDSSLTAEHKIYIEDYLRKAASGESRIFVGTSVEFSKSLISDAITKAKSLNQNQLNNLHKYALRVPSLT